MGNQPQWDISTGTVIDCSMRRVTPPSTTSDNRGQYSFNDLQMGDYDAAVSATGFADASRTGIAIAVNTVRRFDVQLSLSTVEQSLEVSGFAEALQTDRSDVAASIGTRQITDLPVVGQRNYQSLLGLVPGVAPPRAQNSQAGNPQGSMVTNVNGTSYSVNASRLDGASNNPATALERRGRFGSSPRCPERSSACWSP